MYQSLPNGSSCNSIFEGGASNTIVKTPKDLGPGSYARVISLTPLGKGVELKARDAAETYELTVDYDLAAASEEQKGDVNFRVDYTNLLEYWKDITGSPADKKRKRWFGQFDAWLKKMTKIVKDEKGSLQLDYVDTIKLFHAHVYCPATNLDATFDIDASISLALQAQYGYYFEGAILPSPQLIAAYGYFSIEPIASSTNRQWGKKGQWTGQFSRHFTMNLMSSSSQSNPRLLGPYGGAYSALESLPIARVAGGVNTFGSNIF